MSKIKRCTWIALCTIIIFNLSILTGCKKETVSVKDIEFLTTSKSWYHYDEITGESEKMSFYEDFTFYWGCICGEPIGNSDCFELFEYDKESAMIKLYNDYDNESMELEVIDYSDYHLLLKIDGKIKDYTYCESGINVVDSEKYMAGYSGEFAVLNGNKDEIVLGPFDYDGDIEYPENAVKTYPLTENVETCTLFEFTKIIDGVIVENTVDYKEIEIDEAVMNMEYGGCGFIWFNDNMEVNKILFYGATVAEQ